MNAPATATTAGFIGQSVRRREDARFLTGRGQYTDDISRPGQRQQQRLGLIVRRQEGFDAQAVERGVNGGGEGYGGRDQAQLATLRHEAHLAERLG